MMAQNSLLKFKLILFGLILLSIVGSVKAAIPTTVLEFETTTSSTSDGDVDNYALSDVYVKEGSNSMWVYFGENLNEFGFFAYTSDGDFGTSVDCTESYSYWARSDDWSDCKYVYTSFGDVQCKVDVSTYTDDTWYLITGDITDDCTDYGKGCSPFDGPVEFGCSTGSGGGEYFNMWFDNLTLPLASVTSSPPTVGSHVTGDVIWDWDNQSGWSCDDDCAEIGSFPPGYVEATGSTFILVNKHSAGSAGSTKTFSPTLDLSGYDNCSIWWWQDDADFTWDFVYMDIHNASGLDIEGDWETIPDETWTELVITTNLDKATSVDQIMFLFDTKSMDSASGIPGKVWFDYLACYPYTGTPEDSCTAPASGDWKIEDNCTLGISDTITGDLNITAGSSLNITNGGTLTVQGGEIYIWSPGYLRIESGGQING